MQNKPSTAVRSLIQGFFQLYPGEAARLLNTFSVEVILKYLRAESSTRAAEIFTRLNQEIAVRLIDKMEDVVATPPAEPVSLESLLELNAETIF